MDDYGLKGVIAFQNFSKSIPITKASKVSTQIFGLVRWFGPPVLLTGVGLSPPRMRVGSTPSVHDSIT